MTTSARELIDQINEIRKAHGMEPKKYAGTSKQALQLVLNRHQRDLPATPTEKEIERDVAEMQEQHKKERDEARAKEKNSDDMTLSQIADKVEGSTATQTDDGPVVKAATPTNAGRARAAKTKKVEAKPKSGRARRLESANKAANVEGVTLKALAAELKINEKVARAKLRKKMSKPGTTWTFTKKQADEARAILKR